MLMNSWSRKSLALLTCMLVLCLAMPFSVAEVYKSVPMGKLMTPDNAIVAGASAPAGTVVFSGESVVAERTPALITFRQGSKVALVPGAKATFVQAGTLLQVRAEKGTIGFEFVPGQKAQIEAGTFRITATANGKSSKGELALDSTGYVTIALSNGSLVATDTTTGETFNIDPRSAASVQGLSGKGAVTNKGNTFTDRSQNWQPDELKGKTITINGESHQILSNTANTITIKGVWTLDTGNYQYTIVSAPQSAGMSKNTKIGIGVAAAGGGAAAILAVALRKDKSPS